MAEQPFMAIFPSDSIEGIALKERLHHLGTQEGFTVSYPPKTDIGYLHAAAEDDVIVFDATREPDGTSNIALSVYHERYSDRILVVSRNYLPINFYGIRREIGKGPGRSESLTGVPVYPHTHCNDNIVEWLLGKSSWALWYT